MAGRMYQWFDSVAGIFKISAGAQVSAGVADAGKLVSLNAAGLIDDTMLSSSPVDSGIPTEAISAGDAVNVFDNASVKSIRKADASNGWKCDGFATEAGAIGVATKYDTDGARSAVAGVAIGVDYYLGNGGAIVTTPITTAGFILQRVGSGAGVGVLTVELDTPATFE